MKKKEASSPLAAAVEDVELAFLELERLTEQALRYDLNSEKHLQSTASALQGIGALESRLRGAMSSLASALGDLNAKQQVRLDKAAARADELKQRHEVFVGLMERYRALGDSAGELQKTVGGIDSDAALKAAVPKIVETVSALVAEAESVESDAEKADFNDVMRHVSSLRQQLASLRQNLVRKLGN